MSIKKIGDQWKVDFRIGNKRYRHTGKTKIECIQYRDKCIAKKDTEEPGQDHRRLKELIELWYEAKGIELADHKRTLKNLLRICDTMKNPIGKEVTANHWHLYKQKKRKEGFSDKTLNNMLGYINAVLYLFSTYIL